MGKTHWEKKHVKPEKTQSCTKKSLWMNEPDLKTLWMFGEQSRVEQDCFEQEQP